VRHFRAQRTLGPPASMITRRRFLAVGILGAAALAGAGWWSWTRRSAPVATAGMAPDARAIVQAIVPAMLGDALPAGEDRAIAVRETVDGVSQAIAGLPPSAQSELGELFTMLSLPVARRAFAGVAPDWPDASVDEVAAFLDRWSDSGWALKRSAYGALHQLVIAAWYGNPRSWKAIGYDGPPKLGA
jgi:hypothetical protein